jgi:hypothetical protein
MVLVNDLEVEKPRRRSSKRDARSQKLTVALLVSQLVILN